MAGDMSNKAGARGDGPGALERPAVAPGGLWAWRRSGRPMVPAQAPIYAGGSPARDDPEFRPPSAQAIRAEYRPASGLSEELLYSTKPITGIPAGEPPWAVLLAGGLLVGLGFVNVVHGVAASNILVEPIAWGGDLPPLALAIRRLVLVDLFLSAIFGHVLWMAGVSAFRPPWRFGTWASRALAWLGSAVMVIKTLVMLTAHLVWIRPARMPLAPFDPVAQAVHLAIPANWPWLAMALLPLYGIALVCLYRPSARAWYAYRRPCSHIFRRWR